MIVLPIKPLSALKGEREGPTPKVWEGEVGLRRALWDPAPSAQPSPPVVEREPEIAS
jgi:hypothetical protein